MSTEEAPAASHSDYSSAGEEVGGRVLRGTFWVALSRWGTMLVSWPTTILLARLLDPSDYGYLALVTVFTRFGSIVAEAGVSSTVLLGPRLSAEQYARLHGLSAAIFVGVGLVLVALSVPIEHLYDSDGLRWVLVALSMSFLAEGLMVVPIARMRREIRFKELASAEAARVFTDAGLAIALAFNGFRHWALVGGYLGGITLQSFLVLRFSRMRPGRPSGRGIEQSVKSARQLMVGSIANFVSTSSDAWVGARVVGTAALGGYAYMNSLSRSPLEKISGIVSYAGSSLLANMGSNAERIGAALLRILRVTAIVMFPVFTGIALVAEYLVLALLGAKWMPYVRTLQFLCAYAAFLPLISVSEQALVALGNAKTSAENGLILLATLPASFYFLGSAFGATGLAIAWFVPLPIIAARVLLRTSRSTGLRVVTIVHALGRPFLSAAIMAVAVLALLPWLEATNKGPLFMLLVTSLSGAGVYLLLMYWMAGEDLRWLVDRIRGRSGIA